jgi:hypothetical protein
MTTLDVTTRLFRVEITATTDVAAPADQTWAVLVDTAAYPDWNPLIRRLDGRLAVGEGLEVDFQPDPASPARTMRPRVVALEPGRRFAWLGRLGLPGLVDGRHTFLVEPTEGGSRLVQHEVLSGLLVPFARRLLAVDTPRAFVALNDALAARAATEQRA